MLQTSKYKVFSKTTLYFLVISFFIFNNLIADENIQTETNQEESNQTESNIIDKRNTYLFGNLGLNGNFYSSNFKELVGARNCCNAFESAFGIGYQANIGLEFEQEKQLFSSDYSYFISLGLSNISANYNQERLVGYKIYENEYKEVWSRHILEPNIMLGQINAGLILQDFAINDFNLKFGVNLGKVVSASFSQYEEAIRPNDFVFENNERIIDKFEGDITNEDNLFIGLNFGGIYNFINSENYKLGAEAKISYGITDLYKNLNWKIFNTFLGLNFSYNLTQPKQPEPIKEEPKVEIKEVIVYNPKSYSINPKLNNYYSIIYDNDNFNDSFNKNEFTNIKDKEINTGDTIKIHTIENRYISTYSLKPVIYYEPDNTNPIIKLETNKGVKIDTYENIINQIGDLTKTQNIKTIKLITYRNNEQPEELINQRVGELKEKLTNKDITANINSKNLNFEIVNKVIDKSKFKNDELIEENNKIEIVVDNLDFVSYELVKKVENISPKLQLNSILSVNTELPDFNFNNYSYSINYALNSSELNFNIVEDAKIIKYNYDVDNFFKNDLINQKSGTINILKLDFSYNNQYLDSIISNKGNYNTKKVSYLIVEKKVNNFENIENNVSEISENTDNRNVNNVNQNENGSYSEYLLALTEFDSDKINLINNDVLNKVLTAVINGKKVELLGMNDQIGTAERNTTLSKNRALNAKKLVENEVRKSRNKNADKQIEIDKIMNNLTIGKLDDFYFKNDNPYGRTLNRGILVKIFN